MTKQNLDFLEELRSFPLSERRTYLLTYICSQVALVLNVDPLTPIDLNQGFFDLGIDSVTAVELSTRIEKNLNCALPPTLPFDYPTVEGVVDYLVNEVLSLEFSENSVVKLQDVENTAVETATSLQELSDDDLADLLAQELSAIQ